MDKYDDLLIFLFYWILLCGVFAIAGAISELYGKKIEKFLKGRF